MRNLKYLISILLIMLILSGCGIFVPPTPSQRGELLTPYPIPKFSQNGDQLIFGLSEAETATLNSLEQLDDYPLYTMYYYATYHPVDSNASIRPTILQLPKRHWACSLFAAFGDPENMLYGRNFDWEYSPALLLYTDPPDGYASISMVDITYLGYEGDRAKDLVDQTLDNLIPLLDAPYIPFDGLNEMGLSIGMAAVPSGDLKSESGKGTIGSIRIIRGLLDQAANVTEAVAIMSRYNINFEGDIPIHYLISDISGTAALVEYYQGQMNVYYNQNPWQQATNFLISAYGQDIGHCQRYDILSQSLEALGGSLTTQSAMDLLRRVSQEITQWSIIYNASNGEIQVVMGREYEVVHKLRLEMFNEYTLE
jgi:hypothetical protein